MATTLWTYDYCYRGAQRDLVPESVGWDAAWTPSAARTSGGMASASGMTGQAKTDRARRAAQARWARRHRVAPV